MDCLPKVMTPCALTLVDREFVLNWDSGSEAGSSSWFSVSDQHKEQLSHVNHKLICLATTRNSPLVQCNTFLQSNTMCNIRWLLNFYVDNYY